MYRFFSYDRKVGNPNETFRQMGDFLIGLLVSKLAVNDVKGVFSLNRYIQPINKRIVIPIYKQVS